jgi:hypothetical protein
MMMTKETELLKAQAEFEKLVEFVGQATGLRLDEVERKLWTGLLAMGRAMLGQFVAQAGNGDQGQALERDGRTLRRLPKCGRRRYVSIFGELRHALDCGRRSSHARIAGRLPQWHLGYFPDALHST